MAGTRSEQGKGEFFSSWQLMPGIRRIVGHLTSSSAVHVSLGLRSSRFSAGRRSVVRRRYHGIFRRTIVESSSRLAANRLAGRFMDAIKIALQLTRLEMRAESTKRC